MTTLVKSQAAGSGSATSSQSVTIPVQMQNVQGIKTLRTSQNQGQPSMVHLRHQLVQGGPRSKIIPQGGQTILATSQQGQKVALSQVAAGTKGKPYFKLNTGGPLLTLIFETLEKQPCKQRSDLVLNGQMRVPK